MAMDGIQLEANLARLIRSLETTVPKNVAQSMLEETRDNFRAKEYRNDGKNERWPDRHGVVNRKGLINVEPFLRYPMLERSRKLFHSFSTKSGPGYAVLMSSSPYAREHNEGSKLPKDGISIGRPLASRSIYLSNPVQRKFAGVGKRTYKNVGNIVLDEFNKIL